VRKIYTSLINWGQKNLSPQLLDDRTISPEDVESFRDLHIEVARRETRSRRTWELQYEMVCRGEAVTLPGYMKRELVSAALFLFGPKYCYYGVSAAKRELFDKPLSNHTIWAAMLVSGRC